MADIDEKRPIEGGSPVATDGPVDLSEHHGEPTTGVVLPSGWMYRQRKIGPLNIPWYASPKVQLVMVAFVCFLCPGMFNALSGMGGGGKTDATLADQMVNYPLIHPISSFCSYTPTRDNNSKQNIELTTCAEHRSLLHFRRLWLLRRNLCQQARCQDVPVVRRTGILHLRHLSAGLGARGCEGFQYLRWCAAGLLCWSAVDGAGDHYGFVSYRGTEGKILWYFLGYLQLGCGYW